MSEKNYKKLKYYDRDIYYKAVNFAFAVSENMNFLTEKDRGTYLEEEIIKYTLELLKIK